MVALNSAPSLQRLYNGYPDLHDKLYAYAQAQGFTGAYEQVSTVVHEIIHIDSAAHQAYSVEGQYYAPYNSPAAWPAYTFREFVSAVNRSRLPSIKNAADNAIYTLYVSRIPSNTLANLADELNAYGQTAAWLCQSTAGPDRVKTRRSLKDTLRVTNAFLTSLNEARRGQYVALYQQQKEARNLLALVSLNALNALHSCGEALEPDEQTELTTLISIATKERS